LLADGLSADTTVRVYIEQYTTYSLTVTVDSESDSLAGARAFATQLMTNSTAATAWAEFNLPQIVPITADQ
jgi:hypothetical protein